MRTKRVVVAMGFISRYDDVAGLADERRGLMLQTCIAQAGKAGREVVFPTLRLVEKQAVNRDGRHASLTAMTAPKDWKRKKRSA